MHPISKHAHALGAATLGLCSGVSLPAWSGGTICPAANRVVKDHASLEVALFTIDGVSPKDRSWSDYAVSSGSDNQTATGRLPGLDEGVASRTVQLRRVSP